MLTLSSTQPQSTGDFKLTQYSHGSGCGCKVAPAVLEEILQPWTGGAVIASPLLEQHLSQLLVGNDTRDDAAAYDMGDGTALISTVDFFMPILDDAYAFGRIAATNALSDVYAMGGQPFMATAILGWPVEKLPPALAQQVIAGAKAICTQAGVMIAGGHTIDSPEPFFGLSVNGKVAIPHLKRNATAQLGDLLYLTKAIGTGVLTTALKRGLITPEQLWPAIESMCQLNSIGSVLGHQEYVHALTDVTGFGLLGHLIELCEGSQLSATIDYPAIPLLPMVKELNAQYVYADNTMRNWKSYESKVTGVVGESLLTLCDPQTSGGLLIAVSSSDRAAFESLMSTRQTPSILIGEVIAKGEKVVVVTG